MTRKSCRKSGTVPTDRRNTRVLGDSELHENFDGPGKNRAAAPVIKSPAEDLIQDTQDNESSVKEDDL